MSLENAISYGIFEAFTWIRCEGKGSFIQSSALKECAEMRRKEGESCFAIDLEQCTGMDSTFMGFLAGLASRVQPQDGSVCIVGAGERNRDSLEDLGLDFMLKIDPIGMPWIGREDTIRKSLRGFSTKRLPDIGERARHVLECHQTLSTTSDENRKRFSPVIDLLEVQEKQSESPPND